MLAFGMSCAAGAANAQDPERRWQEVTGATKGEMRGMAAGDFDDDGLPDVAIAFAGPAVIVRIEGVASGQWTTKQVLIAPGGSSREISVSWQRSGPDGLVILSGNGMAIAYDGWPLEEVRRSSIALGATAGSIADIDADGDDELVVVGTSGVYVYDAASFEVKWSVPGPSVDLQLLQLDSDAALEIVIAGPSSRVVDGATQAQDWIYPDGFGDYLVGGRFALDGTMGFAGARDWTSATVFRASPWSALWNYARSDMDAIDSCDVEGDGHDEIVIGDGQGGSLHVIDPATRVDQRTIAHGDSGSADVSARDFFGTGGCQLVFAAHVPLSGKLFHVYDASSGSELHSTPSVPLSLGAVAIGDLDGDGSQELVTAANNDDDYALRVADAASGALVWELVVSPPGSADPFQMDVQRLLIAQADDDAAREIVLVGPSGSDSRIVVIDSQTRAVQLRVGDEPSGAFDSRTAKDALLLDFDGDGKDDVVVATQASTTGASGARLHVLALVDGETLWETIAIGTGFAGIVGVLAVQSDSDPAPELVAVTPTGLRAFDASTLLLDWTASFAGGILAAAYDPVSAQIALARQGAVSLHASSSGAALIRTFSTIGQPTALAPIPGPRWVAYDQAHLAVYDSRDGELLGISEWLGPALQGAQLGAVVAGDTTRIASTSRLGHQVHDIGPMLKLFADGFEP